MDDILDELIAENTDQTYSWVSFVCGCISILSFVYILSRKSSLEIENQAVDLSFPALIVFSLSTTIGILSMLISYVKNEPYGWQRQLGAVLNLFLIALILGVIYYLFILY